MRTTMALLLMIASMFTVGFGDPNSGQMPLTFNVSLLVKSNQYGNSYVEHELSVYNPNNTPVQLSYTQPFPQDYYFYDIKENPYIAFQPKSGLAKLEGLVPPHIETKIKYRLVQIGNIETLLYSEESTPTPGKRDYSFSYFLFNSEGNNIKLGGLKVKIFYPQKGSYKFFSDRSYLEFLNRVTGEVKSIAIPVLHNDSIYQIALDSNDLGGDVSSVYLSSSYSVLDLYFYKAIVLTAILTAAATLLLAFLVAKKTKTLTERDTRGK